MDLAPIVLFVYNRFDHTKKTIESLQKNKLAEESELFIYSDAPKSTKVKASVIEVRKYIKNIQGFKKITIIEQKDNLGLAKSITTGVTDVVQTHGKVIVLEDDIVTSPYFLSFMNKSLKMYKEEKRIWHISGWNYPTSFNEQNDTYLYRIMDCWGWATWSDRWQYFEKNTEKLINTFTKDDIKKFNLDGFTDLWRQVKLNKSGRINTWAIYWYASIFLNNGFCLNPVKSLVRNIGHDGTGEHCNVSGYEDNLILNEKENLLFVKKIEENENMTFQVKRYFKKTKKLLIVRIYYKIKTILINRLGRRL